MVPDSRATGAVPASEPAVRARVPAEVWALLAGFALMFAPVYWWAANGIWQSEEQGHGGIILVVVLWLFWQKRDELLALRSEPAPMAGYAFLLLGALIYVAGQLINLSIFKFAAQIPVAMGALLVWRGWPAVRTMWFALLYMVFMIPIPQPLIDAITGQLKQWVSVLAANLLYAAGYPVGRTGVMLTIGQYQLLVADACSGLNSMFSLTALGLLFIYIMKRRSIPYTVLMLASILPIAFLANIIRVMALVLITYYLGDEAAQGFLHGFAGMLLMVVALVIFFLLDAVLSRLLVRRAPPLPA